MCGVLLLHGPAARQRLAGALRRLAHRGPDHTSYWSAKQTAIGFNRLAIYGTGGSGEQPYQVGDLVGAINGEIYNHRELIERHALHVQGCCDTHIVLPLFERLGECAIDELDGFYSGVIFNRRTNDLFCVRDHIGKKPLLIGMSGSELFITSELKALAEIRWFEPLPLGISRIDLDSAAVEFRRAHHPTETHTDLEQLMEEAVAKRIPPEDEPLGVFLSGGLDSSIVAALVSRMRTDTVYYCLAREDSPDHQFMKVAIDAFDLKNVRIVDLPSANELPGLVGDVVRATESFNPSVVSNGVCTYLLAEAAHADGVRVVLTGDGADELFCGYHTLPPDGHWRHTRSRLVGDMHFTELRRLDACCMAHAVEARCPFLDRAVRSHSDQLDYPDFYEHTPDGCQNKLALRKAFAKILPPTVLRRPKTSFDVGSGVRGMVVDYLRRSGRAESTELRRIWRRLFQYNSEHPYLHAYPVFDGVIATRGATHR